jgi:Fe-S-cluster containining protein
MTSPFERRKNLIEEMERLKSLGINCQGCLGTCCTSVANSMLITPIEAQDILLFLKTTGKKTEELKNKLNECVEKYRLNYEISTTRGIPIRRTYTCPFYEPGPKGCSIDQYFKPYGCLGFNPKVPNSSGNNCSSNKEILGKIPNDSSPKKNIPKAMLDIWDFF